MSKYLERDQQVINLQNLQATHAAQLKKKKQKNKKKKLNQKMDRRSKQIFIQMKHTDGQDT